MSDLAELQKYFVGGEEVSAESLIKHLLNKIDKEYKTEIINPAAMSTLDVYAKWIAQEFFDVLPSKEDKPEKVLENYLNWLRINMISYRRKSRLEAVQAIIARIQSELQEMKTGFQKLMG